MSRRTRRFLLVFVWLGAAGLGWGTTGCGKPKPPARGTAAGPSREADRPADTNKDPGEGRSAEYARLHQSFFEATRKNPPPDQRPPDRTMTGKSVGTLYGEVVRQWPGIRFRTDDGRRISYKAVVETELGEIEIALDPELAPNHVRNFVALSRAGYYDGLTFDRIHHEESSLSEGLRYEEIEAGCPLGTGDPLSNSIGYWLKPEFSPTAAHEAGTVGACHGFEADSAACKFYICLSKAPYLDGHYTVFGKVTRGLDVARKIFMRPVILADEDFNGSRRPIKPMVIKKVTIHSREEPAGENAGQQ